MKVSKIARDRRVGVGALICSCFLLGSSGWLAWLYRISSLVDPTMTNVFTLVVGYLAQAVGIGLFMLLASRLGAKPLRMCVLGSLAGYLALLGPAVMAPGLSAVLGFGWLMNVLCGAVQGYYLERLAACVGYRSRGVVFGGGYAVSTLFTWALSSVAGGVLSTGLPCCVVCVVLAVLSAVLVVATGHEGECGEEAGSLSGVQGASDEHPKDLLETKANTASTPSLRSLLLLAGVTVVLVSLVKNAGFSFPAADLSGAVDLELSRLFYGVGLVVAGIAADRERRSALALCAISLVVPFLMLALTGAGATAVVLWALGYLLFGFFTVFRIVLFADLAAYDGRAWIAGAGLALGRVGDVAGTVVCLAFANDPLVLIAVSGGLFIVAAWLLVMVYRRLFVDADVEVPERDSLGEFCVAYDLSAREREVLPLLVEGKTNAEIAGTLFVTESTVKYHVRNIRAKTDCETRLDVANLYIAFAREMRS